MKALQDSVNKQYSEVPGKEKVISRRNKLIVCVVLFVIGVIGQLASSSSITPLNYLWYPMGAVGMYGGIGFAIALHSAKKHYNEAVTAFNNACAEVDKENQKKYRI